MSKKVIAFSIVILIVSITPKADAQSDQKQSSSFGFLVGSLGYHTSVETAFYGLKAYIGSRSNPKGYGLLTSLDLGRSNVEGFDIQFLISNISVAGSYRLNENSLLLGSGGISFGRVYDDYDSIWAAGFTSGIAYIYKPAPNFNLIFECRYQGTGFMLSGGIGF